MLCLHHFLPDFIGGTEIYTFTLAKHLIQSKIEVVVVIPNFDRDETIEYFYEDVKIIMYAEDTLTDRNLILGKRKPNGLEAFLKVVHCENPDIVHFHELAPGRGTGRFHVEILKELKIPQVITLHVPYYTCLRGSLLYKNEVACDGEIIIKKCTACIYQQKGIAGLKNSLLNFISTLLFNLNINITVFNSKIATAIGFPYVIQKIKYDLLKLSFLAEKIIVITDWYKHILEINGVDPQKILCIKQGLPNQIVVEPISTTVSLPLNVVYIGRIAELKGLHILIEALNQLKSNDINLDIYGPEDDSDYGAVLKERTKNFKNIHWMGRVASIEVIKTLSNYHILCLPSSFEMSPLVIQEAFAAGIPVLASAVYGNMEQIKDGENGWLFKLNDVLDLSEKLNFLIKNFTLIQETKMKLPKVNAFYNVADEHIAVYKSISKKYAVI